MAIKISPGDLPGRASEFLRRGFPATLCRSGTGARTRLSARTEESLNRVEIRSGNDEVGDLKVSFFFPRENTGTRIRRDGEYPRIQEEVRGCELRIEWGREFMGRRVLGEEGEGDEERNIARDSATIAEEPKMGQTHLREKPNKKKEKKYV